MPAFLLSPAFWKLAGVAILVVTITAGVALFVGHYKTLEAQAALVPALQKANASLVGQAAASDASAAKAAIQIIAAQKQRDQAVADLATFQKLAGQIGATLNGISANANATKNPICLPSDGERVLFNNAVARFLHPNAGVGPSDAPGQMPTGPH